MEFMGLENQTAKCVESLSGSNSFFNNQIQTSSSLCESSMGELQQKCYINDNNNGNVNALERNTFDHQPYRNPSDHAYLASGNCMNAENKGEGCMGESGMTQSQSVSFRTFFDRKLKASAQNAPISTQFQPTSEPCYEQPFSVSFPQSSLSQNRKKMPAVQQSPSQVLANPKRKNGNRKLLSSGYQSSRVIVNNSYYQDIHFYIVPADGFTYNLMHYFHYNPRVELFSYINKTGRDIQRHYQSKWKAITNTNCFHLFFTSDPSLCTCESSPKVPVQPFNYDYYIQHNYWCDAQLSMTTSQIVDSLVHNNIVRLYYSWALLPTKPYPPFLYQMNHELALHAQYPSYCSEPLPTQIAAQVPPYDSLQTSAYYVPYEMNANYSAFSPVQTKKTTPVRPTKSKKSPHKVHRSSPKIVHQQSQMDTDTKKEQKEFLLPTYSKEPFSSLNTGVPALDVSPPDDGKEIGSKESISLSMFSISDLWNENSLLHSSDPFSTLMGINTSMELANREFGSSMPSFPLFIPPPSHPSDDSHSHSAKPSVTFTDSSLSINQRRSVDGSNQECSETNTDNKESDPVPTGTSDNAITERDLSIDHKTTYSSETSPLEDSFYTFSPDLNADLSPPLCTPNPPFLSGSLPFTPLTTV